MNSAVQASLPVKSRFVLRLRPGLDLLCALLFGAAGGGILILTACRAGGASSPYLPTFGPAPLRFAAAPDKTKVFLWPPLIPQGPATPSNTVTVVDAAAAPTNSPVLSSFGPPWLPPTNTVEMVAKSPAEDPPASAAINLPTPLEPPGNPSGGMLVTPQMVADFLKAGPHGSGQPLTNALPAGELWFAPPSFHPSPGSEATYRVQ